MYNMRSSGSKPLSKLTRLGLAAQEGTVFPQRQTKGHVLIYCFFTLFGRLGQHSEMPIKLSHFVY